jgi:ELWxxDGT repeat protein
LSQGSEAGYELLDVSPYAIVHNTIYFKAGTSAKGFELYKCNTANISSGVTLVKDIVPGAAGSNPANITNVDNTIFFSVTGAAGNQELWKSDGTKTGTVFVKSFGSAVNTFSDFVAANSKLLFSGYTDNNGSELWSSDGSEAGTIMVKDIYAGNHSSSPYAITYTGNNTSLFSANDGSSGIELWKTNGTQSGTVLVKNINVTATASSSPDLSKAAYLNNNFYFSATDPVYGQAPYKTNSTTAGTQLIKDIFPGYTSYATDFTSFKNSVYFAADSGGYFSIYKTNGTTAGTTKVFNSGEKYAEVQGIYAGTKNLFVFYYDPTDSISELWATDGTTEGSYKIQDVHVTLADYGGIFYDAVAVNNTIYFSGYDSIHGQELWKATSAIGSAKMVTDIFTGITGSSPTGMIVFNDKVCFRATDPTNNAYIYISDGTKTGTIKLYQGNEPIAHTNNNIFFEGYNVATGWELYISDGTIAGTTILKDIDPGTNSSYPRELTSADSIIYFQGYDDTHGTELWKSDGTKKGTVMVKDLYAGAYGTYPTNLTLVNSKLYFLGNTSTNYNVLFVSNGKGGGTHQVNDAGLTGVNINAIASGGNKLYLTGYTYALGTELYAGSDAGFAPLANDANNSTINKQNFTANIIGNPVQDFLKLSINTSKQQSAQIIITDVSGKKYVARSQDLNAGENLFSYPVNFWPSGIYIINIVAADNSSTQLKFIK